MVILWSETQVIYKWAGLETEPDTDIVSEIQ